MSTVLGLDGPPQGLDAESLVVWNCAVGRLTELGVWRPVLAPLLGLYVDALGAAEEARSKSHWAANHRYARRAMA
jgi:hypothetical protein